MSEGRCFQPEKKNDHKPQKSYLPAKGRLKWSRWLGNQMDGRRWKLKGPPIGKRELLLATEANCLGQRGGCVGKRNSVSSERGASTSYVALECFFS